jgi:hypothetical protein
MKRNNTSKHKKKDQSIWSILKQQFKKPEIPSHPHKNFFSEEEKRLIQYIRTQRHNGFSNEAIIKHLTDHHYPKEQIVMLIDFITAVDRRKDEISTFYTKLTLGLYIVLVIFFYLLSAALLVPISQLLITFSPIFFATIFALGIFSSRYINNNQIAWFVPLLAVGLFVYLGSSSDLFTVDLGSVVIVNLLLSYLLLALLYYLFITKNKKLIIYNDDEIAFIQLRKRNRLKQSDTLKRRKKKT